MGGTALHHAAENGHENVVGRLLDGGAEINETSKVRGRYWMSCSELAKSFTVHFSFLIRVTLNPFTFVTSIQAEKTALHRAAANDHDGVVSMLLDRGAGIDLQDQVALDFCIQLIRHNN